MTKESVKEFWLDFWFFGLKEAWSCLFAASFFLMFALFKLVHFGELSRYDLIFISAVLLQFILILTKWETWSDALIILVFHIVGMGLEIFKTNPLIGSWSYPEPGLFKIFGVPLFSGFMYASVGSFMMKSQKLLKLRFTNMPHPAISLILCILVYANFFTEHYIFDMRWVLTGLIVMFYFRSWVYFSPRTKEYRMPLIVAFILISGFIWIAENIGTIMGAWVYPDQVNRWQWVSAQKISSWALLVTISFVLIAVIRRPRT